MELLRRFGWKQEQSPTAYSLIDVGRDSVKAAVALTIPGNLEPQIIGYGQAETGGHDIAGGRLEANAVTRPVNVALTQAEDSTEKYIGQKIVPDDAIFILAGRAAIGKLFTVRQTRPTPSEPILAKELDTLRSRAERLVRQGLTESAPGGGQWQPLAVTDAGTRLDNHLVLDGVGLTGKELTYSVFGVAGQAGALRALEVLAHRLDLSVANIVAAPHALAAIVPHTEALILDIGFSGTDACLVKNNALVAASWMPVGGHFFTQSLAQMLKVPPTEARALKHAYAGGELSAADAAQTKALLEGPLGRWYEATMALFADLSPDKPLPRRIYLTGGGSKLPGLERLLRANPEPFDSAPEVIVLTNQLLLSVKDLTDALDYNLFALTLSATIGLPQ